MSEIRYAKITLKDGTRFILRIRREAPAVLSGIEVNGDGEEVIPPGAHQRLRVIEKSLIKNAVPMRMNNKYATLEIIPHRERSAGARKKSPAQLDVEIAEALRRTRSRA